TTDILRERTLSGRLDMAENDGPVSGGVMQTMIAESLAQGPTAGVQDFDQNPGAPTGNLQIVESFKSIDYRQGLLSPPDPDIMVGRDHIVVGVNASLAVYDKQGNELVAPISYATFWGNNCGLSAGRFLFDPWSVYDEEAGRYVLGITANFNSGNNGSACIAVSQTDDATGDWYLYNFDGNPGDGTDYFLDYPHIGVGQDALYVTANMFLGTSFVRTHVFAFDKDSMYAGLPANSWKINDDNNSTVQPAKIKGFATGGWPTDAQEPHYFVTSVWGTPGLNVMQLALDENDPWGTPPTYTQVGDIATTYAQAVSQPQQGGNQIQGNDYRLLDVEYWAGKLYTTHTIGCNPGTGTVNCVRWYEIDMRSGTPTAVQEGTLTSQAEFRSFPDLAVDTCGNMVIGYTKTSSTSFPSVYVAGREVGDPLNELKQETLLKAGEVVYQSFDGPPHRWGDYTGMALDPDGLTHWYVGEYAADITANAKWSTWVAGLRWEGCNGSPDFALQATSNTAVNACVGDTVAYDLSLTPYFGFSDPVTLSVSDLPAGANHSFSLNPAAPPATSTLTIETTGASAGTFAPLVSATAATLTHDLELTLALDATAPTAVNLLSPSPNSNAALPIGQLFAWAKSSLTDQYTLEIATDANFDTVVYSRTTSLTSDTPTIALEAETVYYWRVLAENPCGTAVSDTLLFQTVGIQQIIKGSTNVPLAIGDSLIESTLDITQTGALIDVNVLDLSGTHTWMEDLTFELVSPAGTAVTVMAPSCSSTDNFDLNLDDQATPGSWPCPPTDGGTYQPSEPLAAFNDEDPLGTWTLRVRDSFPSSDSGELQTWGLAITVALPPVAIAPQMVDLAGATTTAVGEPITLTATTTPLTTTFPLTVTWSATGLDGVTAVVNDLTATQTFTWDTAGSKTITVTAVNSLGQPVTTQHTILISEPPQTEWRLYLPLATKP
ncbi:MAG: proprotein convertase P-domain-containing protein, partial [Anaerolineales bacterium]|nr:proprotein convertase P-domain-containing protein [Anaerolineales bacterium]